MENCPVVPVRAFGQCFGLCSAAQEHQDWKEYGYESSFILG